MDDIPMWKCPSCEDLNAIGLEVCRCGERRPSAYSIRFIAENTPLAQELEDIAQKGNSKQRGKKISYDGFTFDSTPEFNRYLHLKDYQQNGLITGLIVHPKYTLAPSVKLPPSFLPQKTQAAITYTPDFAYSVGSLTVYEDVKAAYGNSKKNIANKKAGKPIVTEAAHLRHKLFIAKLASEGSNFHFQLVTVETKQIEGLETRIAA